MLPSRKNIFWIVQNLGGFFVSVIESSSGVGGYNLDNPNDKIIAFDYEPSGKQDYLVAYPPGSGILWIPRNNNDRTFMQVFFKIKKKYYFVKLTMGCLERRGSPFLFS